MNRLPAPRYLSSMMTPREKFIRNYDEMADWFSFDPALTDEHLAELCQPFIPIDIERDGGRSTFTLYLDKSDRETVRRILLRVNAASGR